MTKEIKKQLDKKKLFFFEQSLELLQWVAILLFIVYTLMNWGESSATSPAASILLAYVFFDILADRFQAKRVNDDWFGNADSLETNNGTEAEETTPEKAETVESNEK